MTSFHDTNIVLLIAYQLVSDAIDNSNELHFVKIFNIWHSVEEFVLAILPIMIKFAANLRPIFLESMF